MRILEFRLEGNFEGNDRNSIEYINSIYSYATSVATGFIIDVYGKNDKYDYIVINTGDINIVDFNLPSEKREILMDAGYKQTINYFRKILPKKKELLLSIYNELENSLKKVKNSIENNNAAKAKIILSEMFMFLCDYVDIIDKHDLNELKEFKLTFLNSLIYPALFGKTKFKNSKILISNLETILDKISDKINEYKVYLIQEI